MANNPVTVTTEVTPTKVHSGREVGTTTIGSSGAAGTGAGLGAAIGAIIVYALGAAGIDVTPIEWAIVAVCAAALSYASGLLGGKYSPTDKANETLVKEVEHVDVPAPVAPLAGPVTAAGVPQFATGGVESDQVVPAAGEAPVTSQGGSTARHRADGPAI